MREMVAAYPGGESRMVHSVGLVTHLEELPFLLNLRKHGASS
jgi:hypothetical protein